MTQTARRIKRSSASLKGGIMVGVCVVILSVLVCGELGCAPALRWVVGLLVGSAMGAWVRIADL
ncbi:MAG: hypothetical protein WD229_02015 [Pirellulales bacterium]